MGAWQVVGKGSNSKTRRTSGESLQAAAGEGAQGSALAQENARQAVLASGVLDASTLLAAFSDDPQRTSPFFFATRTWSADDVFVKVYRHGDSKSSVGGVAHEMEMLKRARSAGVRVARVVEEASAIGVVVGEDTFDVLCMRLEMDAAKPDENAAYRRFVVSWLRALHDLHEKAGLLHCDVKEGNVSWDWWTQEATLLDLGFAEPIGTRRSIMGTYWYTAPEVYDGSKPCSQLTDAYGVGVSVLEHMERHEMIEDDVLEDVAKRLCERDASKRLSVVDAIKELCSESAGQGKGGNSGGLE